MLDIETNPSLVAQKGIKENGTLILDYKGREIISKVNNELDITNMIFKVSKRRSF
jgi:hypothetical protein